MKKIEKLAEEHAEKDLSYHSSITLIKKESFIKGYEKAISNLTQTIKDFSDFNYLQGKNGLEPISWEQYLDEYGIYED